MSNQSNSSSGKILIISDVHAKIREMNDFFDWLLTFKNEKIDFAVHLGDFWSGRNFNGKTQTFDEWQDLNYFEKLKIPLFLLKGNEDLSIPDDWWLSSNLWLMKDQEPFYLNNYKVLPIDYKYRGEKEDMEPIHPEFSEKDKFDFILSHRPPLGLLDHTLHFSTHKKLTNTGSPLVRSYFDSLIPSILFFGHFHYSNYLIHNSQLIVCLDKLIRVGGLNEDSQYRYSYALIDPYEQIVEVYWKSRLFFKYSLLEREIKYLKRFDRRNLYTGKN